MGRGRLRCAARLTPGIISSTFSAALFQRICDVYDEEYQNALEESGGDIEYAEFAEHHHFQIPPGAHWKDVRETTVNVGVALQNAMRAIEQANPDALYGIFGDASWTNKERLSDEILTNLIEHYSQHTLNLANVPGRPVGERLRIFDQGVCRRQRPYSRGVLHQPHGGQIDDPDDGPRSRERACTTPPAVPAALLLNCALHLKNEGREYRTLKLYGQEVNLITSAIARMNMFLHGIEEFSIARGDTLAQPAFLENDELKRFNVILANPPYSIKSWDRQGFENDPYGRNLWGTPPQGCADYAFQQHIQKSLDQQNGRSITLWPHGILFREAEANIRRKMIELDLVECVIGLGPNLFYNSPMEACLLITRTNKEEHKRGKILFINAVNEVKQEKTMGFLEERHIARIFQRLSTFRR